MNSFGLMAYAGIALLLTSCNTSKHTLLKREPFVTTPIRIDGNDSDWPSPYPYYDSKAMISYAVSNDRDRLYLSIKASDARMRAKILRGGLSVWIDTLGGNTQHLLIRSPMPDAISRGGEGQARRRVTNEEALDPAQQRDAAVRRKEMMLGAEQYSLTGFGACVGSFAGGTSGDNTCGLQLRLGFNEYNELIWEAAIPFAAWHHHALTRRDAGRALSICFEVGGVKMPAHTTGGTMSSGGTARMGGGGGGRMGGGGMGRGGGGGRMGGGVRSGQGSSDEGAAMSQTTKTWLKTALAYQ